MSRGYCHRCGAPRWEGAIACARCGEPIAAGTIDDEPTTSRLGQPSPAGPGMTIVDPASFVGERGPITERMPFGTATPLVAVHRIAEVEPPMAGAPPTPQPDRRKAMTVIAGTGLALAERFNLAFLGSLPGFRVELAEPVGPSTGGGEQAQQAITLTSPPGHRIAIGRVDPGRRTIAIRNLEIVDLMYQRRFGAPIALARGPYEAFLEKLGHFAPLGFAMAREALAPIDSLAPPEPRSGPLRYLVALVVVVALALVAYVWLRGA